MDICRQTPAGVYAGIATISEIPPIAKRLLPEALRGSRV
jgi:hypothetical protein